MDFTFKIGDAELTTGEAKALFQACGNLPSICIDVANHIDPSLMDATKLFSISVKTKNPQLANLAAKFAIEGVRAPKQRKARAQMVRISATKPTHPIRNAEEAIEKLCAAENLKSLGAGMILLMLKGKKKKTLRQIATQLVNQLAYKGEVSADSDIFRGFAQDSEGHYRPIVKEPGNDRTVCYHASPIYTSLRDGCALLRDWDLLELHHTEEIGSVDKNLRGASSQLRRFVYQIELRSKGEEVADIWNDLDTYISHKWSQRVRKSMKRTMSTVA
jgi:hypothetical protein